MKKIKLKIDDQRFYTNSKNLKKPYFLFLEIGKESFYFSNKEIANKWLSKFEKEINLILREIFIEYHHLFKLNISLLRNMEFLTLNKLRSELNDNIFRYTKLLNTTINFSILREINNFFLTLYHQNKIYLNFLRKNNRFHFLYQESLIQKRNINRLSKDIDILFSSTSGLKKVTKQHKSEFLNFLKVA